MGHVYELGPRGQKPEAAQVDPRFAMPDPFSATSHIGGPSGAASGAGAGAGPSNPAAVGAPVPAAPVEQTTAVAPVSESKGVMYRLRQARDIAKAIPWWAWALGMVAVVWHGYRSRRGLPMLPRMFSPAKAVKAIPGKVTAAGKKVVRVIDVADDEDED